MHTVFLPGSDPKRPRMMGGRGISSPEGSCTHIHKHYLKKLATLAFCPNISGMLQTLTFCLPMSTISTSPPSLLMSSAAISIILLISPRFSGHADTLWTCTQSARRWKEQNNNRSNNYDCISFNLVKCQIIIGISNSQSRFNKSKFSLFVGGLFVFQTWRSQRKRTALGWFHVVSTSSCFWHTHSNALVRVTSHSGAHFQPTLHQMQTKKCLHNDIQSWFKQNASNRFFFLHHAVTEDGLTCTYRSWCSSTYLKSAARWAMTGAAGI